MQLRCVVVLLWNLANSDLPTLRCCCSSLLLLFFFFFTIIIPLLLSSFLLPPPSPLPLLLLGTVSFDHPGCHRHHLWDLQHLLELRSFLPCVEDQRKVALITKVLQQYEQLAVPLAAQLPRCILQNDANDHNVVMTTAADAVAAFLDFGDTVYSWRVEELAVCLAYGAVVQLLLFTGFSPFLSLYCPSHVLVFLFYC